MGGDDGGRGGCVDGTPSVPCPQSSRRRKKRSRFIDDAAEASDEDDDDDDDESGECVACNVRGMRWMQQVARRNEERRRVSVSRFSSRASVPDSDDELDAVAEADLSEEEVGGEDHLEIEGRRREAEEAEKARLQEHGLGQASGVAGAGMRGDACVGPVQVIAPVVACRSSRRRRSCRSS